MQAKIQPTEPHVPIQFPTPSSFRRHFGELIATLFSSVNCFQCFWHMSYAFFAFPKFLIFYVNPSSTYRPIDVFSCHQWLHFKPMFCFNLLSSITTLSIYSLLLSVFQIVCFADILPSTGRKCIITNVSSLLSFPELLFTIAASCNVLSLMDKGTRGCSSFNCSKLSPHYLPLH